MDESELNMYFPPSENFQTGAVLKKSSRYLQIIQLLEYVMVL